MKKLFFIAAIVFVVSSHAQMVGDPTYGTFKPLANQKYVVSCWVRENHATQQQNYSHSKLRVSFLLGLQEGEFPDNEFAFLPSGPIIDGWQRIAGIISIPPAPSGSEELSIKVVLENTSQNGVAAYFDDVRFYPYDGNMKSFVYDNDSRKLLAELDENNYATYYEYDMEGGLIRIKKETEKGVYTIKEGREKNAR